MGLYDRDYARAGSERTPGLSATLPRMLSGLSFISWLIIVNVAVFVLDILIASQGGRVAVWMGDYYVQGVNPSAIQTVVPKPPAQAPPGLSARLPIIESATRRQVGERRYVWMPPLQAVGHFSTARGFFGIEVWRLLTFQFLHADISHLFLNMMGLFFFGPIVEEKLKSKKRTAAFYLVCGIFGAILYLALNTAGYLAGTRFPPLLFVDMHTPLIGASAGVFAILMASAYIAGNSEMLVMGIVPMKIRTGAYLMTFVALVNLLRGGANAGGDAAHVGGAIAGYFFIRNTRLLRDFFDVLGPPRRSGANNRGAKPRPAASRQGPGPDEARVDEILDKVNQQGMLSLTPEEQQTLERATRAQRGEA